MSIRYFFFAEPKHYIETLEKKADIAPWLVALISTTPAVVLIAALLVIACICIKRKTSKFETDEAFDNNPYSLAEYGLTEFIGEGDLKADSVLEKGLVTLTLTLTNPKNPSPKH